MVFYPQESELNHVLSKNGEVPEILNFISQLQTEGFIGEYFPTS